MRITKMESEHEVFVTELRLKHEAYIEELTYTWNEKIKTLTFENENIKREIVELKQRYEVLRIEHSKCGTGIVS